MASELDVDGLWSRDSPPQTVKPCYKKQKHHEHSKINEVGCLICAQGRVNKSIEKNINANNELNLTSSGELSPLLSNGLLNHWEKSSDELNMLGNKKLSSAHSSSRLFCIYEVHTFNISIMAKRAKDIQVYRFSRTLCLQRKKQMKIK